MAADDPHQPSSEEQKNKIWKHEEEVERWKAEYETMLREAGITDQEDMAKMSETLISTQPGKGAERRSQPRYEFRPENPVSVFAHMGPKAFRILNVSVGGVAFFSEEKFEPGTTLLLSALGMVALDVTVLNCDMVETSNTFMEYQYLVRSRFSPRVNGYLVYVLAREMYLKQMREAEGKETAG